MQGIALHSADIGCNGVLGEIAQLQIFQRSFAYGSKDNVGKSMEAGFQHVASTPLTRVEEAVAAAEEAAEPGVRVRPRAAMDRSESEVRTVRTSVDLSRRSIICGKQLAGTSSFATMSMSGQHLRVPCSSLKRSSSTVRFSWRTCLLRRMVGGISGFVINRALQSRWANYL